MYIIIIISIIKLMVFDIAVLQYQVFGIYNNDVMVFLIFFLNT